VAEDDELTGRRLAFYQSTFADLARLFSGRVVNAAGDSILAEFSSPVEAVRCAIGVQESLRIQNLAYPPGQQMNCRIGVTVGDVVECDAGVMTGDGVNVAARLESLAPPGGICASHAVYEQVHNKISAPFADLGERTVKNIPHPIHAHILALAPVPQSYHLRKTAGLASWRWPSAVAVAGLALLASTYLLVVAERGTVQQETVLQVTDAPPPPEQVRGCAALKAICARAGFRVRAAWRGIGLWVDCVWPIVLGVPERPRATIPLPRPDAKTVAACKRRLEMRRPERFRGVP
jgi:adenylate cyclase